MLTKQRAFDTVAIALRKQRRSSIDSRWGCALRGAEGFKCAIGHLISDEDYSTTLEGKSAERIVEDYDVPSLKSAEPDFAEFLNDLQDAHDLYLAADEDDEKEALGVDRWRLAMARIAGKYDLDYSTLHEPLT